MTRPAGTLRGSRGRLVAALALAAWLSKPPASACPQAAPPPPTTSTAASKLRNLDLPQDLPDTAKTAIQQGVTLLNLGKIQSGNGQETLEKAVAHFRTAASSAPKSAIPLYYRGIAEQLLQDYEEAKKVLEKAVDLNPQFFEALVELGDTYRWRKEYDKALETYDKALKLHPTYGDAYRNKAWVCLFCRKLDAAKTAIDQALKLSPKDGMAQMLKGLIEQELKGPGFEKTYEKETEHYRVLTDDSQELADFIAKHAELIFTIYTNVFPKVEKEAFKFPIYVFKKTEDYQKWGGPPGTGGFYNPWVRKLVFFRQVDKDTKKLDEPNTLIVLYHEGFHQFLHYYIEDAPIWFNEGHGDYFGALRHNEREKKMYARVNPWRIKGIQGMLQGNNYTPLKKLLVMTQAEMYSPGRIGQNYAQAWSFVYYLWEAEGGKYRPLIGKYFQAISKGAGLKKAYETTFGKLDIARMEKEWKKFVLDLPVPADAK